MKYLMPFCLSIALIPSVYAAELKADMYLTKDKEPVGVVTFTDSDKGLVITPELKDLPVGVHGFHLHQTADCGNQGANAGSHYDPAQTNSHQGPLGKGHLGDLPALTVNQAGQATESVVAPHLKTADLTGLSIIIHAGGDNYSDNPMMGGGGARLACGIIKPTE